MRAARLGWAALCAVAGLVAARAQTSGSLYIWSTFAGAPGVVDPTRNTRVDGASNQARFFWPFGVAVDATSNVFVADSYNNSIRKITPAGLVTSPAGATVAGLADGAGGIARFNTPQGIAVDSTGNLYVADTFNQVIRKISAAGVVSTIAGQAGTAGFADGIGAAARFNFPRGVALDGSGNIYVTDSGNNIVRKIDSGGAVSTLAGLPVVSPGSNDGTGSSARFSSPWGIAADGAGNLFVTDYFNSTIRRITLGGTLGGVVSTVAGSPGINGSADGPAATARFFQPGGIAVDGAGNLYVADTYNHTIRKILPNGTVSTIGGKAGQPGSVDGLTGTALFSFPYGIALDAAGNLYVADQDNSTIRGGSVPKPPVITVQPQSVTVTAGVGATFSVVATALPSATYQWTFNGVPIAGATSSTISVNSASARDAGDYRVTVTSVGGVVVSGAATLTVNAPPAITAAPVGSVISVGGTALLSVNVAGSGPLTYQWLRDGVPVAGANSPLLATDVAGTYTVVVSNGFGSTTSTPARVDFPNRLVNLSTRGTMGAGPNALVAGLVIGGAANATKALLIRGIGPTLANFGVENAVTQTAITVVDTRGVTVAANQGWFNNSNLAQLVSTTSAVGAFALPPASGDSALLVNLAPGAYTVNVSAANTAAGNGLVEIYEVGADNTRLVNLSTRGVVSAGSALTAGVVVQGTASVKLLVRGVGPALAQFGVAGALVKPQLTFYNGSTPVAINTGWGNPSSPSNGSSVADVSAAATATGAFPFAPGSDDCALVLTNLGPGNYTATVSGVGGTGGVALVEVYQVP